MRNRIVSGWSSKPAGRLVRPAGFAMAALVSLIAAQPVLAAPAMAIAAKTASVRPAAITPRWFANDSRAADVLIDLLETSSFDGLNPSSFPIDALKSARLRATSGDSELVMVAERKFDEAFVRYVMALRADAASGWIIVDKELTPGRDRPGQILARAAAAPSLADYVGKMAFLHPAYAELRRTLEWAREEDREQTEALVRLNMQRLRMLPPSGRYVVVNAASQQLQMVDNGRIVGGMKVVVGKPKNPTPVMAAYIRFAALNPYWEVPPDLAAERVAPGVVAEGLGYLEKHGYVALSDWGDRAANVDPSTIDWQAVADGRIQVRLRQNPGSGNAMGRMKFMFPNAEGVYLHDTPNKELLNEDARLFSGGCVRLEDAPRLAEWMFGKALDPKGAGTEQRVDLPKPIPVYIAYLTAMPDGDRLAIYEDIYGRDEAALAGQQGNRRQLAIF